MSTTIYFTGGDTSVGVEESPEEVQAKLNDNGGLSTQLTQAAGGGNVFVNPQAVAYWWETPHGGASFS